VLRPGVMAAEISTLNSVVMTPESVVQIFVWSKRRSGDTNGSSRSILLIPSLADQCCDPLSCQTALSSVAGRCGQIAHRPGSHPHGRLAGGAKK
jgi:hypothetical protein